MGVVLFGRVDDMGERFNKLRDSSFQNYISKFFTYNQYNQAEIKDSDKMFINAVFHFLKKSFSVWYFISS